MYPYKPYNSFEWTLEGLLMDMGRLKTTAGELDDAMERGPYMLLEWFQGSGFNVFVVEGQAV